MSTRTAKVSRLRKPEGMSLEEWQVALRSQFGRQQSYTIENLGTHPIFSVFRVTNPESGGSYRVTVRGARPGDNHCSCPDFSINTLGTCKHIEFALGQIEKRKGFAAALARGHLPPYSEIFLRYRAKREVVFRAGVECPPPFVQTARRFFDEQGRLRDDAYDRFPEFLELAGKSGHEVRCHDDALGFVARARDSEHLRRRLDQAFPQGPDSAALARLLKVKLYPYQREGALFAARAGRCLLADDMGLGKTIQAIAVAEILAQHGGAERVLVICPTSLKHQWRSEVQKFTGRQAVVVEGGTIERNRLYRGDGFFKIVNYDVVHRDLREIQALEPDLIILDEAQRIKNWKTRAARSVKQLESPHAIVLTGTPLENRLEELHSIVEFVDRFRLGPAFRFLAEHQHTDETGRVIGYRNLGAIAQTLAPVLLRRHKNEVLKELPQRLEKRLFVPMTPQQQQHHDDNKEIVARLVAKWKRNHFLSDADQRRMTIALQYMRMSCNSTYLIDEETDFGTKADELAALLDETLEDRDAKVVIFSQWVRTHELLIRRFEKRGLDHVLFHGGVDGRDRGALVERFKNDPRCRLFLSTDAGGVGLNLQHASVVMNVDQPWNPAILEQRIGRVHRLGQQRPVRVVHFIAKGTIEEGMLNLLSFKRSVFAGVLDGGKDEVFLGGTRLKQFMQTVEQATGDIPAPMPTAAADGHGDAERETADAETALRETTGVATGSVSGAPASGASAAGGAAPGSPQAWADVAAAGLSLLERLSQALQAPAGDRAPAATGGGVPANPISRLLVRDEKTGEQYLKLPMPAPEALGKIVELLQSLAGPRR